MVTDQDFQILRDRLAKLEEEFAFFRKQFSAPDGSGAVANEDERIIEQIKKSDLMAAIKIYQETHHSSLAEAKQYVRELAQGLSRRASQL
ncbi:MAG TPA: hypothetical protein VMT73_11080 [Anaerolineales bacterium]|nr:hypothetical protein [Anaerolineales bacterium]